MDKQLAAATLATLIPVTLLAGYFSSAGLKSMTTSRYRVGLVYLYLLIAFAGEISAGLGVISDHATTLEVSVAAIGSGISTTGMFTVMAVSVREARTDHLNRHQRSEPGATD